MREIQSYWIDELKNVEEFKEIANVQNPEIKLLWDTVANLLDDQFIETATQRGIVRRESILKITPFADDTLETRRFRVSSRWNDQLPYSYRVLENKLNQLCGKDGYTMALNNNQYTLNIKIELTQKRMFNEVQILSRKIVPSNMIIKVELRYNQHSKLANFTHRQLSAYTHAQLREEVL
jgi:hypothetical protein